jgi:cytochrome P450
VVSRAEAFAGCGWDPENGQRTVDEFLAEAILYINDDAHRRRRGMLNRLLTPDSLDAIRHDVVLPAADRMLAKLLRGPGPDGRYRMDLVDFCERVFLHFTAKLIGLVGIDSDEALSRLRQCVGPITAGTASAFLDDRAEILEKAIAAKRRYVEEFFNPSRAAMVDLLSQVARGERDEAEVPWNMLRFMATHADPAYENENTQVIESTIMMAASIGTSTQAVIHTVVFLQDWFRDHPEDFDHRTEIPFLLSAIQETIRLRGTFAPYTTRVAGEDGELGGFPVRRGQELHIEWPMANRDTTVFGEDAGEFNPRRSSPAGGVQRYGVGFGTGIHQCFGLRVVLGADGAGGSHVYILQKLFRRGIEPDQEAQPSFYLFGEIPRYTGYPVLLDNWTSDE